MEAPYTAHYEIESINGRDVERIGLTQEKEVLFKADTYYAVDDFVVNGNTIDIKMREADSYAESDRTYKDGRNGQTAERESSNAGNKRTNEKVYTQNDSVRGRSTADDGVSSGESDGFGKRNRNGAFENSGRDESENRNSAISKGVADGLSSTLAEENSKEDANNVHDGIFVYS